MKIQIPTYRAKKKRKDVNERIEGILLPNLKRFNGKSFIISDYTRMQDFDNAVEIDPSTLAIHFPQWICSDQETEEEVKVFASLRKDKRGGSILELRDNFQGAEGTLYFNGSCLMFQGMEIKQDMLKAFEVTGIQD